MKILRQIKAKWYGVPFCVRVWYNFLAHTREKDANGIIIFVTYRYKQQLYQYRVVAYQDENPNRDWLYGSDYIHPIIEFVRKL